MYLSQTVSLPAPIRESTAVLREILKAGGKDVDLSGESVATMVSLSLTCWEGCFDGCFDGRRNGCHEGCLEGCLDGWADGRHNGCDDGMFCGCCEG